MKLKCIVCKREFEAYDKKGHHGSVHTRTSKRPFGCKTCSPQCARDYPYLLKKNEK